MAKLTEIQAARLERWLHRGKLPRLILVIGEEAVLRDRAVDQLIQRALDPDLADFNLDRFSGDQLEPGAVIGACATLPMMAERRVVLVRRFQILHHNRRRKLLEGLRDLPESTLAIIEGASLTPKERSLGAEVAGTLLVSADRPGTREVLRAVADEAERLGLKVEPGAAEALLAARGNDLTAIAIEIDKLASFVGDRGRVTREDVVALVPAARAVSGFDLANALALGDLDHSLRLLDALHAAGEDPLAVVGAASHHFLVLWRAVLLGRTDRQQAVKKLKVPFFYVDRYLTQAARLDLNRLHAMLGELLQADLDLKSGVSGDQARRSRGRELVLRICTLGGKGKAGRRRRVEAGRR